MEAVSSKHSEGNGAHNKDNPLHVLSKADLIDRIRQLEYHVNQLKNVIAKHNRDGKARKKQFKPGRPFDFKKYNRRHVALKICYLGWDRQGFVVQEDTNNTIEAALFESLIKTRLIESRETSNYHRCGRTDVGVSAFGQVITIDLRTNLLSGPGIVVPDGSTAEERSGDKLKELDYLSMLNKTLPDDIRVLAWAAVTPDFSARFDCLSRVYKYFFPKGDLNVDVMNDAAQRLLGEHDFRNLCKMDVGNGVTAFSRAIHKANIACEINDGGYTMCTLTVSGKAFLWHQIRCIVALLFLVGKGLEPPSIVDELLDVEKNPCKPQYTMASQLPLNLYECTYEDVQWIYDNESAVAVTSHLQKCWAQYNIKAYMLRSMISDFSSAASFGECSDQADNLVAEYRRSGSYNALLGRTKCKSLEDRKEHFAKRKKICKALEDQAMDDE